MPFEVAFIGLLAVGSKPVLSVLPERRMTRAVERVRPHEALSTARKLYTASAFEQCASALDQAEARLRTVLARERDFEVMKQINLWLVCVERWLEIRRDRRSRSLGHDVSPAPDRIRICFRSGCRGVAVPTTYVLTREDDRYTLSFSL